MPFCPICNGNHSPQVSCTDTLGRMGLKSSGKRKLSKEEFKKKERTANRVLLKLTLVGLLIFGAGMLLRYWGDIKGHDGRVTDYYGNGRLAIDAIKKNGKIEGLVKKYHDNGQLATEAMFKNGKLDGVKKEYYKNGQLKLDGVFKNKKPEGILREYYESGQLKAEGVFRAGEPVGTVKKYDETGKLKS